LNLDKDYVLNLFPAKDFRKYQRETIERIVEEFKTGVKAVLLDAPTGFGKSPVNATFCRASDTAFYTTPQLTLIDQLIRDKLVGQYITEIKGRQNYFCKFDPAATCDVGLCKRLKEFSCQKAEACPYWIQKLKALKAHTALMSFAYFILEGHTETDYSFGRRELLVLDECLPYTTEVLTEDGFKKIGSIVLDSDNYVYGVNGCNVVKTEIIEKGKTKVKECIKITTASKRELVCSEDHPLYDYKSGWVEAKSVDRVAVVNERKHSEDEDEVLARLFGYFLGDGWLSVSDGHLNLGVSGDIEDLEQIRKDLNGLGYKCNAEISTREQVGGGTYSIGYGRVNIKGTTNSLYLPVEVAKLFADLYFPIGDKTNTEFYVPDWVKYGSDSVKSEFLAGLFGAEGWVPAVHGYQIEVVRLRMYKNVTLAESHWKFFEEVKKLLNDLGIEVSQIKEDKGNVRKDGSTSFMLTLTIANNKSNLLTFLEKIGFAYCKRKERKACKIHSWLAEGNVVLGRLKDAYDFYVANEMGSVYEASRLFDVSMCTLNDWKCRGTKPNWTSVSRTQSLPFDEWCGKYTIGDIIFEKVTKKESIGKLQTYNLKTGTENFIAGDYFMVHNSHSIDRHVINHISLTVSPWSIPFELYKKFSNLIGNMQTMSDVAALISAVKDMAEQSVEEVVVQTTITGGELSITQATSNRRLEDFISNADRFLNSIESTEWVWDTVWSSYHGKNYQKLIVQPLYARSFMQDMIWSRAKLYIISSATLLNIPLFVHETGLDSILKKDEILHISIPSTFPPENRPIVDRTNGRLTMKEREKNIAPAVKILERILDQEEGKNVAVHCHSYEMSISIQNLIDHKYKERLVTHTPETRQEALELWKNSHGKVFLAVSFTEGQDWIGEICEAQVLFKVPFLDINDKRVEKRLDKRHWGWYYNEALKTTIQSYGRAVRSPEDKARFYVIDMSFVDLIRRCKGDVPAWFKEALPPHWRSLLE